MADVHRSLLDIHARSSSSLASTVWLDDKGKADGNSHISFSFPLPQTRLRQDPVKIRPLSLRHPSARMGRSVSLNRWMCTEEEPHGSLWQRSKACWQRVPRPAGDEINLEGWRLLALAVTSLRLSFLQSACTYSSLANGAEKIIPLFFRPCLLYGFPEALRTERRNPFRTLSLFRSLFCH